MSLVVEATLGRVQLEIPEEVVGFLEVRATSNNLIDKLFNRIDLVLAKSLDNDFIASKRDSLLVNLSKASLVNQIGDNLSGGVTESNIRFNLLNHVKGSSVNSEEGGVVNLSKSEQSQDLSDFRRKIVNTSDSYNKSDLSFSRNIERTLSSSLSSEVDEFFFLCGISLVVLLALFKVGFTSSLDSIDVVQGELLAALVELRISGPSLIETLWNVLL